MNIFRLPQKEDWISSLVVFIVAIPLSLGIALASGGSPAAGLISAVIGGIVTGALAGAPFAVTGPAAGLTAFVFQIVQQYGFSALAAITVICGGFQLIFGFAKCGRFFKMIPKAILEGVLSAIGFIIVFGQLHVLMGAPLPKSPIDSVLTLKNSTMNAFDFSGGIASIGLAFGMLALFIQIMWPRLFRKWAWIPAALPAVLITTLASLSWDVARIEIAPLLPSIKASLFNFFSLAWLEELPAYLISGFGLAFVASAESLLTARAADTLVLNKNTGQVSHLDQELVAQGVGNACSGILGGLPITAVMARTAVNIHAGAKTRWSTILHGAWIAICVSFAPILLTRIPVPALAAVLVLVGIKLMNVRHFLQTWRQDKVGGFFWSVTALAVVSTDLLSGLIFSLGIYCCLQYKTILRHLWGIFEIKRTGNGGLLKSSK